MTDVVAHLRACCADFMNRHANPRVAWDCLGAKSWAKICDDIANEIEELGLHGEQAIGYLKGRAHAAQSRADAADQNGYGIIISLDMWSRFDEIIDPIARDRRGWIEVSGHAEYFGRDGLDGLPTYRRMLGVNQCVAALTRGWSEPRPRRNASPDAPRTIKLEDEASWEARRLQWLGRYHPGLWVVHKDGGWHHPQDSGNIGDARATPYTPLYGTVAQHMSEPMPTAEPRAIGTRMHATTSKAA